MEISAMSSRGLNLCTLAGNVAADPQVRSIERKTGGNTQVANLTIYVDRIPSRKESDSFTVELTVWEDSPAWRKLTHIKKGSLIIASGAIDASPYLSKADSQPRAGLQLKVNDIFLDSSPRAEDPSAAPQAQAPRELATAEF
jgi:single-strand DNA-binding protein